MEHSHRRIRAMVDFKKLRKDAKAKKPVLPQCACGGATQLVGAMEGAYIRTHRVHCPKCQAIGPGAIDKAAAIKRFVDMQAEDEIEVQPVANDLEHDAPTFELDETQLAAIAHAVGSRFAIISGSAGTGKSTIIKEIAAQTKGGVRLCAFAGKAAARLKEATKRDASTIHRMLGYNGQRFTLDTLQDVTVIIDEASMVSADLLAEVVNRRPKSLVLVGDFAQLDPVGKGKPFHDLIKLKPEAVYNLTKCWRNKEAVFKAASSIRAGEMPEHQDQSENEQWTILKSGAAEKTHMAILEMVKSGAIDFEQDIILCPKNGKLTDGTAPPCTVKSLNQDIVDIVNPRLSDEKFMVGDRVMNLKNVAEADVWNGTTGTVHAIDQSGEIWVKLDIPIVDHEESRPGDRVYKDKVLFTREMVKSLTLAYALTVHKSQGSQYRKVVVVVLERDSFALLTRPLIYTAVTRTQKECIVVGQVQALAKGINATTNKRTVIQELSR